MFRRKLTVPDKVDQINETIQKFKKYVSTTRFTIVLREKGTKIPSFGLIGAPNETEKRENAPIIAKTCTDTRCTVLLLKKTFLWQLQNRFEMISNDMQNRDQKIYLRILKGLQ